MQRADLMNIVTDLLLSGLALRLALGLLPTARRMREFAIRYWFGAFVGVAAAGVLAGIFHAFAADMDPRTSALIWTVSMTLAIAASFLFLIGTLHAYTSGRLLGWLAGCAVTKFVLFAMWAAVNDDFRLVMYDSGLTLGAMLLMASWFAWLQREPSAPWILAGVMTAMVAALFQQGRVSIHRYFNHNDLYHLIQMGALYCFYRAGEFLRDKDPNAPDFEATQQLPIIGEE
jgi:hypothetical protein